MQTTLVGKWGKTEEKKMAHKRCIIKSPTTQELKLKPGTFSLAS